jgi:8-oxo-dGTP pyrophosphatase MutT (NUDIX family)/phosphohistidine phosphatase SixA
VGETVRAAGAVLWRGSGADVEVAVVHRPRYDDWSLPKGKLDRGETVPAAAEREVLEETGFRAVLGRHLTTVNYPVEESVKTVDYFSARAASGEFVPNDEVDDLRWLPAAEAAKQVSYPHDRAVLDEFVRLPADLITTLLVRHAKAGKRENWDGDDELRPLSPAGRRQVEALRKVLPLWDPRRVHSAPPLRCVESVRPLAEDIGVPVILEPRLSEKGYEPDPDAALVRFLEIVSGEGTAVVCSQGGVIPGLLSSLAALSGLPLDDVPSKKGSVWVLSFTRPAGKWSTSEPPASWPRLVDADYVGSSLPRP